MAYELACCIALKDTQVYNHLMPLALHPDVDTLWVVRSHEPKYGHIPKARYIIVSDGFRPLRWARMLWACLALARRKEVRGFVSFNPFPYGLLSFMAACLCRKPMHFGLIGSDWNAYATGRWSWLLIPVLRQGSFLTAYGAAVCANLIARGIDASRVTVLPHSIALERFPVSAGAKRYTAIFTGALVPNKRVDVILRGFARVLKTHPKATLCIAGDGPLRDDLQTLARQLDISASVDFVGFVNDVQPYLAQSRTLIMASEAEGLPFSIVEALCSGVVPITTPVNAIATTLRDGVTAMFYAQGDDFGMAVCLTHLLENADLYDEIRKNVIALRTSFSFDAALAAWRPWLDQLSH